MKVNITQERGREDEINRREHAGVQEKTLQRLREHWEKKGGTKGNNKGESQSPTLFGCKGGGKMGKERGKRGLSRKKKKNGRGE